MLRFVGVVDDEFVIRVVDTDWTLSKNRVVENGKYV